MKVGNYNSPLTRKEKRMTVKTIKTMLSIFAGLMGITAFIALYIYDWKLGIIIFFLMFANNISISIKDL